LESFEDKLKAINAAKDKAEKAFHAAGSFPTDSQPWDTALTAVQAYVCKAYECYGCYWDISDENLRNAYVAAQKNQYELSELLDKTRSYLSETVRNNHANANAEKYEAAVILCNAIATIYEQGTTGAAPRGFLEDVFRSYLSKGEEETKIVRQVAEGAYDKAKNTEDFFSWREARGAAQKYHDKARDWDYSQNSDKSKNSHPESNKEHKAADLFHVDVRARALWHMSGYNEDGTSDSGRLISDLEEGVSPRTSAIKAIEDYFNEAVRQSSDEKERDAFSLLGKAKAKLQDLKLKKGNLSVYANPAQEAVDEFSKTLTNNDKAIALLHIKAYYAYVKEKGITLDETSTLNGTIPTPEQLWNQVNGNGVTGEEVSA